MVHYRKPECLVKIFDSKHVFKVKVTGRVQNFNNVYPDDILSIAEASLTKLGFVMHA